MLDSTIFTTLIRKNTAKDVGKGEWMIGECVFSDNKLIEGKKVLFLKHHTKLTNTEVGTCFKVDTGVIGGYYV